MDAQSLVLLGIAAVPLGLIVVKTAGRSRLWRAWGWLTFAVGVGVLAFTPGWWRF